MDEQNLNRPVRGLFYRVFMGNMWTSGLIIFAIVAFIALTETIINGRSYELYDFTKMVLRLTIPAIIFIIYLVYRLISDGRLKRQGINIGLATEDRRSARFIIGVVLQYILPSIMAGILALFLYYLFFFSFWFSPLVKILAYKKIAGNNYIMPAIFFSLLVIGIFKFWLSFIISSTKSVINEGRWPTLSKVWIMLFAFLMVYFGLTARAYILTAIYEADRLKQKTTTEPYPLQTYNFNRIVEPELVLDSKKIYAVRTDIVSSADVDECQLVLSSPSHLDISNYDGAQAYYCKDYDLYEPRTFYRFLYEKGGIFPFLNLTIKSVSGKNLEIEMPQAWQVEENLSRANENIEIARFGCYSFKEGKTHLCRIKTKIFDRSTYANDFLAFAEEVRSISSAKLGDKNWQYQNKKIGDNDAVLVDLDRFGILATKDLYIFIGLGQYVLIQDIQDFMLKSLEAN